ncbi:MAG: SLC13 family permease [Propionicimonas sp.]|nr:ArsB/NhaD family transporter [Propionicimonas sp.]
MVSPAAELLAVVALLAILGFAITRPRGLPEAVVAVPAAVVVVLAGAIRTERLVAELSSLLPVVAFLAAVLVISELCGAAGLFRYAGSAMARASRGSPRRMLLLVFGVSAATTAVLSLDATVVLLTPVVFATASRVGVRPRPHVYATTHLANAGSLLLPVSNLTNLLAVAMLGIGFLQFAGYMVLPWLVVLAVEYAAFRWYFAGDLRLGAPPVAGEPAPDSPPWFVVAVVAAALVGFVAASAVGLDPAWVAAGGAVILAARALWRREARPGELLRAANLPFLGFVLSLGVVVAAVVDNGLAVAMAAIVPAGTGWLDLLAWAGLAAVLANLVNNLPAALVLLPLAVTAGTPAALAVLIGVNVGPNLTYVGSLATLLWRRIVRAHDHDAPLGEFTALGVLATPVAIIAATTALWAVTSLMGA